MLIRHAPLDDSIVPNCLHGIGGWQFLVRETDPAQPQWGDGTNGQTLKRAQFISKHRPEFNTTDSVSFLVVIPEEWAWDDRPVMLAGLHGGAISTQPWALYVVGDQFRVTLNVDEGNLVRARNFDMPIVRGHVYRFDIAFHPTTGPAGYLRVVVNGQELVGSANYYGPTISTKETGRPYLQFGLYVFRPVGEAWPFKYRRAYMALA